VDPSDVRNQTGTFAEAFARHEKRFQSDMERVQRWRVALTDAANCSGWDLERVSNGYCARSLVLFHAYIYIYIYIYIYMFLSSSFLLNFM